MSPERLAQLERHFRNPGSASCNSEWALELVEEVKALRLRLETELLAPPLDALSVVRVEEQEPAFPSFSEAGAARGAPFPKVDAEVIIDDRPKKKSKR